MGLKELVNSASELRKAGAQWLLKNTGIKLNGDKPWDIQVHDYDFYKRVLSFKPSLEFGETYMDGLWDSEQLDETFYRIHDAELQDIVPDVVKTVFKKPTSRIFNQQTMDKSKEVAEQHYDLPTVLFEKMLDSNMQYSCSYYDGAESLEEAQMNKLELIARKLDIEEGDQVLDIGCGWGGLANYLTELGAAVTGVTLSEEQAEYARKNWKHPLNIQIMDYRNVKGSYDKVVSVGMLEHVGHRNYEDFFEKVEEVLKPGGLFLLESIGRDKPATSTDPWIDKYIFPNGMLPAISQLSEAWEGKLHYQEHYNFGPDYDKTLMHWKENLKESWDEIKPELPEDSNPNRFWKMMDYYLSASAGGFRAEKMHNWHLIFSKPS